MYYYIKSEPRLWTVGTGEGENWNPVEDFDNEDQARSLVHYLNGGKEPPPPWKKEIHLGYGRTVEAIGRNGKLQQVGMEFRGSKNLILKPVSSTRRFERVKLEVPYEDVPAMIRILESFLNQ